MRAIVRVAVLAVTALTASCSGDAGEVDPPRQADAGAEPRVTLTDAGCTYEGDTALPAGAVTIEVVNASGKDGAFALGSLTGGATLDDLEAFVDEERGRIEDRVEIAGRPEFYTQDVRVAVDPGGSSLLPAELAPGTYAVTCFNDPPPTVVYVAAQLDMAE